MPYKSEAQRRFFNSPAGKAKIGKEEVGHWNEVSKGKKLPAKLDDAVNACDSKNYVVEKGNAKTGQWSNYGVLPEVDVRRLLKGYSNNGLFWERKGSSIIYLVEEAK